MSVWGEGGRERERDRKARVWFWIWVFPQPSSLRSAVTLKMQVVGLRLRGGGYERDFFGPGDINSIHMRIWNFNTGYGGNVKNVFMKCMYCTCWESNNLIRGLKTRWDKLQFL